MLLLSVIYISDLNPHEELVVFFPFAECHNVWMLQFLHDFSLKANPRFGRQSWMFLQNLPQRKRCLNMPMN